MMAYLTRLSEPLNKDVMNLAKLLLALDLVIVGLYGLHTASGGWSSLFDLDGERNFGAWWGGGKLLLVSAAVASVPLFAWGRRVTNGSLYWAVAAGFAWLSADEILWLHEKISTMNRLHDFGLPMFRGTHGAWIGVYAALFALLVILFFRPILTAAKADPKSAKILLIGLATMVSGAVVAEVMGYYDLLGGMSSPLQVAIEESLELIGVSLILLACVQHALYVFRS